MPRGSAADAGTTRERILDVALDLFNRKGYAETSLREIAAELGFSKAALYYHFESKQDILMALHQRLHDLADDVLPLVQGEGDPAQRWERMVDGLIGLALRHRPLIELQLRNQLALAELHRPPMIEKHGPLRQDLEGPVGELIADRSAPVEVRVRRMAGLGTIAGVMLGAGLFADVPDDELERTLRQVVREVGGG